MANRLITGDILDFLEANEYVYIATGDSSGQPYVIPKFLIRVEDDVIYLADHVLGRTIENLKVRPQASIAMIVLESLTGYQINGTADILESGVEYNDLLPRLEKRQMHFSVERIVQGMKTGKQHKNFEAAFPKRFAVIRFHASEIIEVHSSGEITRKNRD